MEENPYQATSQRLVVPRRFLLWPWLAIAIGLAMNAFGVLSTVVTAFLVQFGGIEYLLNVEVVSTDRIIRHCLSNAMLTSGGTLLFAFGVLILHIRAVAADSRSDS